MISSRQQAGDAARAVHRVECNHGHADADRRSSDRFECLEGETHRSGRPRHAAVHPLADPAPSETTDCRPAGGLIRDQHEDAEENEKLFFGHLGSSEEDHGPVEDDRQLFDAVVVSHSSLPSISL